MLHDLLELRLLLIDRKQRLQDLGWPQVDADERDFISRHEWLRNA